MDADIGNRELDAAGFSVCLNQKLQAVINSQNFAVSTSHDGQIVSGIADFSKLPVNYRNLPLAAILEHPDTFAGRRVGLIISGGNVDLDHLPW